MAIIQLILKFINIILRLIGLAANAQEQKPVIPFHQPPTVLDAITDLRKREIPPLFDALEADAQEALVQAALKYEDESFALELAPKIKNPDYAYRSLMEAIKLFHQQDKSEALAKALKLAYPLLPKLSFASTPIEGFNKLNQLAVENLKPNIAWSILVKSEKVLPELKQLDQDVSRELLAASRLSVLRSISNPQHGQKLLHEIVANIEAIDSYNIKERAKITLLEAQLAIFQQFEDQAAWQQAQQLGTNLAQAHNPKPIALLLQTASKKPELEKAQKDYFERLDQARIASGQKPFVWLSHLKIVAEAYQAANQLEVFFDWVANFPAYFQLAQEEISREEGEDNYDPDPFRDIYKYLSIGEICLTHQSPKTARIFLEGILSFIPEMNEQHLYREKTIATYLDQLAKLYSLEQKTDLFEAVEQSLTEFQDQIQLLLLISLSKTYFQLGWSEKALALIKDLPLIQANLPAKMRAIGGRVFKPLFAHLSNEQHAHSLVRSVTELLALEEDQFKQAMIVVTFLRGAEEEDFSFSAASAERLIEGIDRHGKFSAQAIGRAAVVEHIQLSAKRRSQILNEIWNLLKTQAFDKDLREQIFWSLPMIAQYEPDLAKSIVEHLQPSIQALTASTQKQDWQDSISWGISQGDVTDWGIEFVRAFGEAATEKAQSTQAHTIERWSLRNPKIEDLVSLLELAALLQEPIHRARALSSIVAATARIGEWDYAFKWVEYIKLYYYTALAHIEMMIASNTKTKGQ